MLSGDSLINSTCFNMNGTVFFGKMEHQNIARNLGQDGDRACASYKEMALKILQKMYR